VARWFVGNYVGTAHDRLDALAGEVSRELTSPGDTILSMIENEYSKFHEVPDFVPAETKWDCGEATQAPSPGPIPREGGTMPPSFRIGTKALSRYFMRFSATR
jgi:hypothetical protein